MNSNLSVIIPTLNNVNGLSYLLNYFKGKSCQKIVVDNRQGSPTSTPIGGGSDTEHLVYLPQEKNLGFAGGVNKGRT